MIPNTTLISPIIASYCFRLLPNKHKSHITGYPTGNTGVEPKTKLQSKKVDGKFPAYLLDLFDNSFPRFLCIPRNFFRSCSFIDATWNNWSIMSIMIDTSMDWWAWRLRLVLVRRQRQPKSLLQNPYKKWPLNPVGRPKATQMADVDIKETFHNGSRYFHADWWYELQECHNMPQSCKTFG